MSSEQIEIPLLIGGKEVRTGDTARPSCPHDHGHVLATYHQAGAARSSAAAAAAQAAWQEWSRLALGGARRASSCAPPSCSPATWRDTLNAATMLGQSKTAFQAEIDAACELIDFWRFNVHFAQDLYAEQPGQRPGDVEPASSTGPLEGFVFAVTPFNFTAIGGNLPTAPALMGNTVLWKPPSTAIVSALLHHAAARGGRAAAGRDQLRARRRGARSATRAGAAATSRASTSPARTPVFNGMWKTVGDEHRQLPPYPRIVGETGGKDFIFAHPSADAEALAVGDRARRLRVPGAEVLGAARASTSRDRSGPTCATRLLDDDRRRSGWATSRDFRNFMGAVIDERAVRQASAATSTTRRTNARPRSSPAASGDERRAGSSSRRSSRPRNPRYRADVRGDLRAGGHGLRLRDAEIEETLDAGRHDVSPTR